MMRFYFDLQKSSQIQSDKIIVQGIAGGTLEDRDNQRVSKGVIQRFVDHINTYKLLITNGHRLDGGINEELGEATHAEMVDRPEGGYDIFLKAELNRDNPNVQSLVTQVNNGKKFGFSVDGMKARKEKVWSENLKTWIEEFVDAVPRSIGITTRPSYIPSFLEVLQKSEVAGNDERLITGDSITIGTTIGKVKEVSMKSNDSTTNAENPLYLIQTEQGDVRINHAQLFNLIKSQNMSEEIQKDTETSDVVANVVEEKTNTEATTETESETVAEVETVAETEAVEAPKAETIVEEVQKSTTPDVMGELLSLVKDIKEQVTHVNDRVDSLEKSSKEPNEEVQKSHAEVATILKSFHDDIEAMKDMTQLKKSVVRSQTFEDRVDTKPKTVRDLLAGVQG